MELDREKHYRTMKSLATQNFPTREDFKQRFNKKLRGLSQLFEPLTEALSEEAESYLHSVWLESVDMPPEEEPFIKVRLKSRDRKRHYCSNCTKQHIHPHHNYCPNCGIKIIWT